MSALTVWALIAAAAPAGIELQLDESPVVLGRTESVGLTLTVEEPQGSFERRLFVAPSVGSCGEVVRLGPGKYRTVYVPPRTRFPQVALLAVWRELGPDSPVEFLRLPLLGVTRLAATAAPKARVSVVVGDRTFGPEIASAKGEVKIPLEVGPGVKDVQVRALSPNGAETVSHSSVDVPAYNRLTAALVPHVVPWSTGRARLSVFYDLGGFEVPPEKILVKPSVGAVRFLRAERGRYEYEYAAPASDVRTVTFSVSVLGDPASTTQASLELGLPAPARLVLKPPSAALRADGKAAAPVRVLVTDAAGMGIPGLSVEVLANGKPLPVAKDLGEGVYESVYAAPELYPPGGLVELSAAVKGSNVASSVNYQLAAPPAPTMVEVTFSPNPVWADGRSEAEVIVELRDAAGQPVTDLKVLGVASIGTLGLLTRTEAGRYRATYVAPASAVGSAVTLELRDDQGGFRKSVPVPVAEHVEPKSLALGVRAGVVASGNIVWAFRPGAELLVQRRVLGAMLGFGVTAGYSWAEQSVSDSAGLLSVSAHLDVVPLSVRVSYSVWSTSRLSVVVGAGGLATFASLKTSLGAPDQRQWGFGALGFAAAVLTFGPAEVFAELSYAWAPVRATTFFVESGGVGAALGVRLGVL